MKAKDKDVKVEMPFEEFLSTFFYMYSDDAEVLAKVLGYGSSDDNNDYESYQDYIDNRVDMVTLLKAKNGADLSGTNKEYIEGLATQIEKNKEKHGDKKDMEKEAIDALVEKAANDAKAEVLATIEAKDVELTKALETLEVLKKEKEDKEKGEFVDLVKSYSFVDEEKRDEVTAFLFKARNSDGFGEIVATLEKANKVIEEFATVEKGHSQELESDKIEQPYNGVVSEILKSRKNA